MTITAAGVVFLAKDTGRCLLQLRDSDKRFKHTWGFFGGTLGKNESPIEAIQRELLEEIGFVPDLVKLNPIDVYHSPDQTFIYWSFAALVDKEFSPILNEESAGYAWVDIGAWPKPLHAGASATLLRNGGNLKLKTILDLHT